MNELFSSAYRRAALAFLLLCAVAVAQAPPQKIVIRPVVNMYSAPTTDADVVSQAIYATRVGVLEEKDGWTRVRTPDDYTGWVQTSDLLAPKADAAPYGTGQNIIEVRSLFAHIYRERDVTKHAPLLTVPFETVLETAASNPRNPSDGERWLEVRLPDGRQGWIQNGDIGPAGKALSIDDTIALAKKFLGLPYTWGGTSSYGYDCSGFVQMLVRERGKIMPRDADVQAAWTGLVPVEKSDLKPGDLLFFGSSAKDITHTGMYIGDGQFINATTYRQPMVRIDNLNEPRWIRLLVAARRLKE